MDSDTDCLQRFSQFPFEVNITSELSSDIIFWLYICSFDCMDLTSYQKKYEVWKIVRMHYPRCPEFHFKGRIKTWFASLFIQLHSSIAWGEYQSFTKPMCQDSCLLKAFNIWHCIKHKCLGFFPNRLLLWYFSLVMKEKPLRFCGIFYVSVDPV